MFDKTKIVVIFMKKIMKQSDLLPEKGCSSCQKGLTAPHWAMLITSIYILFSSIYGTIQLIKFIFGN